MRSSFKTLLTFVVTMCAGIGQGHAADLMYVTLTDKTVVTYDISQADATSIQNSKQTFGSYTDQGTTNPYGGVVFDSSGNLLLAREWPSRILKYNPQGQLISTISATYPNGLAVTPTGDILYSQNVNHVDTITRLNSSGVPISTFSGGVDPYGLAVDTSGNIYAANAAGNVITKYTSSGQLLSTIGSSSNLNTPVGIVSDSSGYILVTNNQSNTVSKFDGTGQFISNIGDNTNLSNPYGLTFDKAGNLFVANAGSSTISKFNSSGQFQFSWSTGTSASKPLWLAVSPNSVPEPSTYALAAIASGVMSVIANRRRKGLTGR